MRCFVYVQSFSESEVPIAFSINAVTSTSCVTMSETTYFSKDFEQQDGKIHRREVQTVRKERIQLLGQMWGYPIPLSAQMLCTGHRADRRR